MGSSLRLAPPPMSHSCTGQQVDKEEAKEGCQVVQVHLSGVQAEHCLSGLVAWVCKRWLQRSAWWLACKVTCWPWGNATLHDWKSTAVGWKLCGNVNRASV